MNVHELTGEQLDAAVAVSLGWDTKMVDGLWYFAPPSKPGEGAMGFSDSVPLYSKDWSLAGPIIERECIEFEYCRPGWIAYCNPFALPNYDLKQIEGPTPIVAAMRAFVFSKLGAHLRA